MIGENLNLSEQIHTLDEILKKHRMLYDMLRKSESLGIANYYIGAGCVAQTVWNYQNGSPLNRGINDMDFVYYDDDRSYEAEDEMIRAAQRLFAHCPFAVDVKNQARVHIWYKERFGYDITPYTSVESAINTWPTTATSVGVRLMEGHLAVYAPFGLNDLFSQIVRPNKTQITRKINDAKAERWTKMWPTLRVIPW